MENSNDTTEKEAIDIWIEERSRITKEFNRVASILQQDANNSAYISKDRIKRTIKIAITALEEILPDS